MEQEEKRTEEKKEHLKKMCVRKGVAAMAGLFGAEKVLGEPSGVDDILDVLDIADLEESDK